jgi:hypothetical protein
MPKSVNALAMPGQELWKGTARSACDAAAIMLCQMDNGAICRITGWATFSGHGNWYRVAGTDGAVESLRQDQDQVFLRYNHWSKPEDAEERAIYAPEWQGNGELAEKAGHGGGDFWTTYYFAEAIRNGTQPYFDVYRGVTMSSLGILAWKSVLAKGMQMEIPDFRDEESRKKYENDHFNPFPMEGSQYPNIPVSSVSGFKPSYDDIATARAFWDGMNL